jgi:predicted transcriptional regulator
MKLTKKEVKVIYTLANDGLLAQWYIAKLYGITQVMVSYIKNKRRHQDV